jgi:tRNA (adenine57-N1/adenine58-N1)-methyltransferase
MEPKKTLNKEFMKDPPNIAAMKLIGEGDDVLLYLDDRRTFLVGVEREKNFHTHKGYVQLGELVGKPYGSPILSSLGVKFHALKPLIRDRILKMDRKTQVLYPKDIGYILFRLDIRSGSRVVEAGTGSGALTCAMADIVKPSGKIFTYELFSKFMTIAENNVNRAGLKEYVEFKEGDVTEGIEEKDVDAVVLDLATPWKVVPTAYEALRGGGVFASFSPTIEQVMKTVTIIRENPFVDTETVELLLRKVNVEENKTRPQTLMIGHSGYITTARKILE